MLNFIRQIPSYIRGTGFEDEYDVEEFINFENTTRLQCFLACVIVGLLIFIIATMCNVL